MSLSAKILFFYWFLLCLFWVLDWKNDGSRINIESLGYTLEVKVWAAGFLKTKPLMYYYCELSEATGYRWSVFYT